MNPKFFNQQDQEPIMDDEGCMEEERRYWDNEQEQDPFLSDAEADGDALASVGWGTDEDYGSFGGEDW